MWNCWVFNSRISFVGAMEGNGAVSETPLNSIKNGFIDEKVGFVSFIQIHFVFFFWREKILEV